MLADFLSGNLASPEDAPAVPCALLQARASAGSQAPPWAFDADAQAMLPLESMLDMLGQQPKPGAHHAPLLPAPAQSPERCAPPAAQRMLNMLPVRASGQCWAVDECVRSATWVALAAQARAMCKPA